jgi:serine/threonine protein phosphatase PrpC
VADGMGAHAVGELASELAVGIIPHTYDKYAGQGTASALRKAFIEANTSIHNRGQQNREFEGMGTTATALVLRPDGAWVAHVGDSRVYRVRDGQIDQLSFDHSMVWEYARRQKMDPDEVQGIPPNVIFRSLGPEPLVPIDIEGVHAIREGDVYVLCSDGLSGQLSDAEIGAVVSVLPPAEACRFLVDLANLRGGPDNITVIVARVGGELATAPPESRPWHEHWLLPLLALFLGALLAGGGVAFTLHQEPVLALSTVVLAVLAIVGGVVGLVAYHNREKRRLAEEAERPRPKIHRSQPCKIERALVEKLARAAQGLKAQAREKGWQPDWDTYESLYDVAETHLSRGDFVPAFRDYCRAMQTLMAATQGQGGKAEIFQPKFDRPEALRAAAAPQPPNGRDPPAFRCESCGKISPTPPGKFTPVCCERPMKKLP